MVDVDQGMDTRCYGMKAQPPARIDAPEVCPEAKTRRDRRGRYGRYLGVVSRLR